MNQLVPLVLLLMTGCVDAGIEFHTLPVAEDPPPILEPEIVDVPVLTEEPPPVKYPEGYKCLRHPTDYSIMPGLVGQSMTQVGDEYVIMSSGVSNLIVANGLLEPVFETLLTVDGKVFEGHPVGLAYQEGYPTFIGSYGRILLVDWDVLMIEGTLDNALQRAIPDSMGLGYSRPVYVTYQGDTVLATADYYSPDGTRLRLFDPWLLKDTTSTGSGLPGLWIRTYVVDDWVQSMTFHEGTLYLVRNSLGPSGWEIDRLDLETGEVVPFRRFTGIGSSELEGFGFLPDGREVYVTGDHDGYIWVGSPAVDEQGPENCAL